MEKILEALENKKCIGCGNCKAACNLSAIRFETINGFLYPQVDSDKCMSCGRCDKVCPVNGDCIDLISPISFYAAYVTPGLMKPDSTSGGICTFASETMIQNGGVVFSARFTDDWNVEYAKADCLEQLQHHIGSKYMQAYFSDVQIAITKELKQGKKVLLVGTPCFISSIKKFLNKSGVNEQNLITVDFMCHGVPSAQIGQRFIQSIEEHAGRKLEKYNFRSKAFGWGKLSRSTKFQGKKEKTIRADFCPLHTWFGQHLSLRESCFVCDYRNIKRISDITVADFWKIDKYYPEIPMKQGISAVQINTIKGKEYFDSLIDLGSMVYKEVSKESIWEHRKTANSNFNKPKKYDEFWRKWNSEGLIGIIEMVSPQTYKGLIKDKLKSMMR